MLIAILTEFSDNIFLFIEKFSSKPYWAIKLAFFCTILYLLTSFPAFYSINGVDKTYWKALDEKIKQPLKLHQNYYDEPWSNLAKRAFRLTMPVTGHIFGLKAIHLFIIQHLIGVLFFILLAKLLEGITLDRVSAVLLVISFSFIYVGKACFWDIKYGWFDGVAYFLLTLAFLYPHPFFVAICTFAACWVDERAVLASFFVFFWWKIKEKGIENTSIKSLFIFSKSSTTVLIVWIAYFLIRFYLGYKYNLSTPIGSDAHVGMYSLKINLGFIAAAILSPMEFFWILLALSLLVLYKLKFYFQLFLLTCAISVITIVALSVGDVTRSLCYVFPSIFIGIHILTLVENQITIRYLTLGIAVSNFIIGSYFILNEIKVIAPSFKIFFLVKDWLL